MNDDLGYIPTHRTRNSLVAAGYDTLEKQLAAGKEKLLNEVNYVGPGTWDAIEAEWNRRETELVLSQAHSDADDEEPFYDAEDASTEPRVEIRPGYYATERDAKALEEKRAAFAAKNTDLEPGTPTTLPGDVPPVVYEPPPGDPQEVPGGASPYTPEAEEEEPSESAEESARLAAEDVTTMQTERIAGNPAAFADPSRAGVTPITPLPNEPVPGRDWNAGIGDALRGQKHEGGEVLRDRGRLDAARFDPIPAPPYRESPEVFEVIEGEFGRGLKPGWYWRTVPTVAGSPDAEPKGPYDSEDEARTAATYPMAVHAAVPDDGEALDDYLRAAIESNEVTALEASYALIENVLDQQMRTGFASFPVDEEPEEQVRTFAACFKLLRDTGKAPLLAQRIGWWLRQAVDVRLVPSVTAFVNEGAKRSDPSAVDRAMLDLENVPLPKAPEPWPV